MCNCGPGHSDLELWGMGSSRKYHELFFCGVKSESSIINPVDNDVDIILQCHSVQVTPNGLACRLKGCLHKQYEY